MREVRGERGLALVVVLWILAFLGVVFTTFTFSMRTELAAAGNFKEQAESYYVAEAGVYRAAAEIINADRNVTPDSTFYDASSEHWHTNQAAYENVALGGGHYWVAVRDEESKIPLNGPQNPTTDAMLRRLFSNSGVTDEKLLSIIVDSIQDWRDTDNLHRLNGAEDDYYLSRPTPYRTKNGDFESVEELLLVKGMTPEILYGNIASQQRQAELGAQLPWERDLKPGEYLGVIQHLSVHSSGKVNVNTASSEVLMALGLTAAETRSVLDRRTATPFRSVNELTNLITSISGGERQGFQMVPGGQSGPASPQQLRITLAQTADVRAKSFAVESAGRMAGSRLTVRVAAILQNDGTPGRPKLSIRLWSIDPRQGA
ncbi:MAG: general secretion pathway protein GspK [Candidatus Methylomirabilis oxyfera]|nr:general secretion pathway protein GspK [Candidatus Methylomirabilis oxyfera]